MVSGSYSYTQDSSLVIMVFMNSGSRFVESSMSCETSTRICFCSAVVLFQSFRHFPYKENPTGALNIPHSNAACHQLTLLTGIEKFMHAYEGLRLPHASVLNWNPPGLRKKKKVRYFLTYIKKHFHHEVQKWFPCIFLLCKVFNEVDVIRSQ